MRSHSSRRDFLKESLATASVAAFASASSDRTGAVATPTAPGVPAAPRLPIKKAVLLGMLPKRLSYSDRFTMARDVGFEGVQTYTTADEREAEEIRKAAEDARVKIESVMNTDHWKYPLSSADPAVVEKSMEGMRTSLRNAKLWGADAVLLVPAVVNSETSYRDAWTRSQQQIRRLLPLAEELGVVIAIEEVWNKFLLSPLEFAQYVDEFHSPWVKAWFDVGNVVLYGYPQDWIRTLGKQIVKVHLKDFKVAPRGGPLVAEFVNLGDGDIDWAEVRKGFADIGYAGFATTELQSGEEPYLRDVSSRVDRLLLSGS